MNAKLSFSSAYNRPRNLSPLSSVTRAGKNIPDREGTQNGSAVVSKLQKEVKLLQDENKKLTAQILELRDSVKQIFSENKHEKYDERRINMIKFQLIQLERQISILTEALESRSGVLLEVENSMSLMADKLRSYITADVKGQMVPIARSDLVTLVESSESSRIKLFKSIEAQLESKLSLLYKELVQVHNQIETVQDQKGDCRLIGSQATLNETERLKTTLLKAGVMTKDSCDDLMALSLLCPSAPWPILKRPVIKDVPLDRVLSALPPLSQTKQEEVGHILKACLNTLNYRINLLQKEKAVLAEELAFHRSVYDAELEYTNVLFGAVREGCKEFEESAQSLLCKPIKSLLDAYRQLETTKSEDAFKRILLVLKANIPQMTSIVEMFEGRGLENNAKRSEALSSFSTDFMEHVNSLIVSCQKKRDVAVSKKTEVKDNLRSLELELKQCLENLEAKYDKQWVPKKDRTDSELSVCNSLEPVSTDASICSARLHSGEKDRIVMSPRNHGGTKDFIHHQLFGETSRCSKDDEPERSSSRQKRKQLKRLENQSDSDAVDSAVGALRLRAFLDEEEEDDMAHRCHSGSGKHSQSQRAKKWSNDFSYPALESHSSEMRNDDDDDDDDDDEAELKDSKPQGKTPKRLWKPSKEWVSDFSSNADNTIEEGNKTPGTGRLNQNVRNKKTLHQSDQEDSRKEKSVFSNRIPKCKDQIRSYEVDLRVARPKLHFIRPESSSANKKS